jgi:arylsulfatase A-like enzyme
MNRFKIIALLSILMGVAWGINQLTVTPSKPVIPGYNVLFLTGDSFNKKHLSIYGYRRETMPFLSGLAEKSVVFDQMINPSGWTNESLISIFTSLSSPVHKVETRGRSIDPMWITPIEILKQYGYRAPRAQGTDNHLNLGFDEVSTIHPAQWLENHGKEGRFFLFYHFVHPHLPYNGNGDTEVFLSYFRPEMFPGEASRHRVMSTVHTHTIIENNGSVQFEPEDVESVHALYDGELLLLDREIERTIQALEELALLDNTIVIVGADHGEELLEHGFVGHASTSREARLYDEIANIPFLIYFPRKLPSGKRITTQVRGIDVMPTVLELLEIPPVDYLEGRSLIPVINGRESGHRIAFMQSSRAGYQEEDPENVTDRIQAIRTGDWKLIHHHYLDNPTSFELYDLIEDPLEQHNVMNQYPEKANQLKNLLTDWMVSQEEVSPPPLEHYNPKPRYESLLDYIQEKFGSRDLSGVPSPPLVVAPAEGEALTFDTASGAAVIRWSGRTDVPYRIEYEVGREAYYLHGFIKAKGSEKVLGPFPREYWDSYLTLFSPGKIRVSIDKTPAEWSPWIHFEMASTTR